MVEACNEKIFYRPTNPAEANTLTYFTLEQKQVFYRQHRLAS